MTPNDYQDFTRTTALYPGATNRTPEAIVYCALGLAGEAGEVSEKLKKLIRAGGGFDALKDIMPYRDELLKEIGDVLWYCARLSDELSFDLESTMRRNMEKLASRKERGVIQGSGDNR